MPGPAPPAIWGAQARGEHPPRGEQTPVPAAQGRRQEPAQKGQPGVGHGGPTPPLSPRTVTSSMSPNKHRLTFTEQVVGRACPRNGAWLLPSPMWLRGERLREGADPGGCFVLVTPPCPLTPSSRPSSRWTPPRLSRGGPGPAGLPGGLLQVPRAFLLGPIGDAAIRPPGEGATCGAQPGLRGRPTPLVQTPREEAGSPRPRAPGWQGSQGAMRTCGARGPRGLGPAQASVGVALVSGEPLQKAAELRTPSCARPCTQQVAWALGEGCPPPSPPTRASRSDGEPRFAPTSAAPSSQTSCSRRSSRSGDPVGGTCPRRACVCSPAETRSHAAQKRPLCP